MMERKYLVLGFFILTYVLFIIFPRKRTISALSCSFLIILFTRASLLQILSFVNWNVMGIFLGTLVVADIFMLSKAPAFLAEQMTIRVKDAPAGLLFCSFF